MFVRAYRHIPPGTSPASLSLNREPSLRSRYIQPTAHGWAGPTAFSQRGLGPGSSNPFVTDWQSMCHEQYTSSTETQPGDGRDTQPRASSPCVV